MEARLFPEGTVPEWTTPGWYAGRDAAPHLEQEGHRDRLALTADMVNDALHRGGTSIVDLGAGDGGLLSLFPTVPRFGFDLQQSNVDAARARGVTVVLRDVIAAWPATEDQADVVVATEILEHLLDPHEFVARIASTRARFLIASSPYTETAEHHYEFHTWAWDVVGYAHLLVSNGWRIVRHETAWISQVVLAERIGS